jgi:hypothetical protein
MVEDPFEGNLDILREAGEAVLGAPTPRAPRRKPGYVVLPADWLAALYRTPNPASRAAWVVAVRLVELFQIQKVRTVMLANGTLTTRGVGRWRKYEALRELEGLGLIIVASHGRQAVSITWLVDPLG